MPALNSFWSALKSDNAAAQQRTQLMNAAAFSFTRQEAWTLADPYVEYGVTRTVPLWLYFSGHISDHRTISRPDSIAAAEAAGYVRRELVGHVFPYEPRFAAQPLRQYWNASREDSFLLATPVSEQAALADGYSLIGVEGWAADHVPEIFLSPGADDTNDAFNSLGFRTLDSGERLPRLLTSVGRPWPLLTLISFGQLKKR